MVKMYRRRTCRVCGGKGLSLYLNLGKMPLAGNFLRKGEIGNEENYPLKIYKCSKCNLLQVVHVVDPDILFKNYKYSSSIGLKHYFSNYAKGLFKENLIHRSDFIVEIGSNDGVFLEPLMKLGAKVIGVEPSANISRMALAKGVKTINNYFSESVASMILSKHGPADVITASNVMAHIDDLDSIVRGIKLLLGENGFFVMEAHYLPKLITKNQYDFFYNEHLCYFSLSNIHSLFKRFGMEVWDAMFTDLHGGTIRVFIKNNTNTFYKIKPAVFKILKSENSPAFKKNLKDYPEKVFQKINKFKADLLKIRENNEKIVGYGASGRANTILNSAEIDTNTIEYIVDDSPLRAGKYMPGSHIPIKVPSYLLKDKKIKYCLLLAYTYKDQILIKLKHFIKRGGKIISP